MNKGFVIAGLVVLGVGILELLPGVILWSVGSSVTGETDLLRLVLDALRQISISNEATAQTINNVNQTLNIIDSLPFILILLGLVLLVIGLLTEDENGLSRL